MSGQQAEDAYPVAYCAPGNRAEAERILADRGWHAARIEEHPLLGCAPHVYVAEDARTDLTRLPFRYDFTAPEPAGSWIRDYYSWGCGVRTPHLAVLTSVTCA